jgi:hypothetical protein
MSYSDALEQQLHLYNEWHDSPDIAGPGVKGLLLADTYWVSRAVQPLLDAGARSVPATTRITERFAPSRHGYAQFEEPPDVIVTDGESGKLTAIQWANLPVRLRNGSDAAAYWLFCYIDIIGRPVPAYWTSWLLSETFAEARSREEEVRASNITPTDTSTLDWIVRLWASFCLFTSQRILAYSSVQVERHVRKRVARAGWEPSRLVRVVKLRRKEQMADARKTGEPADWSCQWVVRGHWRQQFYPRQQHNRPIWITPYVKGPEDKPLKPPRATVFAVVR